MGMDDFAQKLAGQIVFVQLPEEGKAIQAGKKFASVESGKWLGKVYGPCQRRTGGRERGAGDQPRPASTRTATAQGWLYKIKPEDMAEVQNLIHGREAVEKWLVEDIAKFVKTA